MIDKMKEISKDQLLAEVKKYADSKAKFVTGSCNDLGDKLEVTYYFNASPGMDMSALRFAVGKDEEVPSMTGIYLTAVLIENEMKELFGLKVKDLAIDFGGHMMLAQDSPVLPMLKSEEQKAASQKGGD
ncbi:MAG: NADH-quinone oxidoreductase subunit C [Thermacetogeniaceae bacterium]|jgi:Ni,Fe-hydrogenase III component G